MISHFTAVLIFAASSSVVFGITQRSEPKSMIRYGVLSFAAFVVGTMAVSWVMFFIKH